WNGNWDGSIPKFIPHINGYPFQIWNGFWNRFVAIFIQIPFQSNGQAANVIIPDKNECNEY
ncbi:hypothetical protein, partial [Klebsiella variicola]|uniref:hypothetical protein n=1 Tax=Klebsiella variicola TaxID=244366 RepID=UPI0027310B52